jgi:hypothetical protein
MMKSKPSKKHGATTLSGGRQDGKNQSLRKTKIAWAHKKKHLSRKVKQYSINSVIE